MKRKNSVDEYVEEKESLASVMRRQSNVCIAWELLKHRVESV